jgi:hypothetical protein
VGRALILIRLCARTPCPTQIRCAFGSVDSGITGWQRQFKVDLGANDKHVCFYYCDFLIEY